MSVAAAVRAGGAFVEIFAKDGPFQAAMARVQAKLRAVGQTMQRVGTGMSISGAALGGPLILAARQAATFEDAILGLQAAAGLGQADIKRLSDEAKRLSSSMGVAPEKLAQAFLELAKAGMSVEDIMAGAGKSAVEFSRVSGVEAERAAIFMKTSMDIFGVSAKEAVDTLSAAADSSPTSIAAMVESFSQVGTAGKSFNQSLFDVAQAIAVLANANIMGEEAGTALKTMLTKLVAPTDDAKEALSRLGLSIADFRDQQGNLLPMQQIVGRFEEAFKAMGSGPLEKILKDAAIVDVFEQRGIKVMTAFAEAGVAGFAEIGQQMRNANPVAEKFQIQMKGITGQFERMGSAIKRTSIEFGAAILPALIKVTDKFVALMGRLAEFIKVNPQVATAAAGVAAGLVAIGTAAIGLGLIIKGLGTVIGLFTALASPTGVVMAAAAAIAFFAAKSAGAFDDLDTKVGRFFRMWQKIDVMLSYDPAKGRDKAWVKEQLGLIDKPLMDAKSAKIEAEMMSLEGPPAIGQRGSPSRAELLAVKAAPKPLGFDTEARAAAAAALAEEDLKDQLDLQQAIAASTDALFETTKGYERLGSAGEQAFKAYLDALGRLQQRVENGGMNLTVFGREAAALDEQFGELFGQLRDQQQRPKPGIFSAGTFGSGEGLGIGPELNVLANPLERIAAGVQQLVQIGQQGVGQAAAAAVPNMGLADQAGQDVMGLQLNAQAGGPIGGAGGIAAAVSAAVRVAQGVASLSPTVSGGLATVAEACQSTTTAVLGNNKLLDRLLTKMDGMKLRFE